MEPLETPIKTINHMERFKVTKEDGFVFFQFTEQEAINIWRGGCTPLYVLCEDDSEFEISDETDIEEAYRVGRTVGMEVGWNKMIGIKTEGE